MNKFLSCALLLGTFLVLQTSARIPTSEFYPFGAQYGDHELPKAIDNAAELVLTGPPVTFGPSEYTSVFVNNNGAISFGQAIDIYNGSCDPYPVPTIMPYYADADTRYGGAVYYRETMVAAELTGPQHDILQAFPNLLHRAEPFHITRAVIATWDIPFYQAHTCGDRMNERCTFQATMAFDTQNELFVIFNYDRLDWLKGLLFGGNCEGTSGQDNPGRVGFNWGDEHGMWSLPNSCTDAVPDMVGNSNVGKPGQWIFKVYGHDVSDPAEEEPVPEPVTEEWQEPEEPIPEGECDPDDCNLQGYCYHYAQCQRDTRQFRVFECSNGLFWNPHNISALRPHHPVNIENGNGGVAPAPHDNFDDATDYPVKRDLTHPEQEQCHGSCDLWENLKPEIQEIYRQDQQCFPQCTYAEIAECENRYIFHPHNTDARAAEILHCPVDTRFGIPLVWVQERQSCDFCFNAMRHPDVNGTIHSCCERYDGQLGQPEEHHQGEEEHPVSAAPEDGHHNWAPADHEGGHDDYDHTGMPPSGEHYYTDHTGGYYSDYTDHDNYDHTPSSDGHIYTDEDGEWNYDHTGAPAGGHHYDSYTT